MLIQSATDILTVLQTPPPSLVPKLHYGNNVRNALEQLARLLHCAVQRTKASSHKLPSLPPPSPLSASTPRVQPPSLLRVQPSTVLRRVRPCRLRSSLVLIVAVAAHLSQPIPPHPIAFANPDPPGFKHQAYNHLIASQVFSTPMLTHIYNEQTSKRETIDSLLAGKNSQTWRRALSNEIG